jgi:hypothetical protein
MIAKTVRILFLALAGAGIGACDQSATSPLPSSIVIDDSAGTVAWKSVSVGTLGSCAITTGGKPYCWGFEPDGVCSQAGCAVWSRPTPVTGPTPIFDSTTSGAGFYCGLTSTGEAHCWGEGKEFKSRAPVLLATPPPPLAQISANYTTLCVLAADGVVSCSRVENTMAPVSTPLRFKSIEAGVLVSCGIDTLNDGYCWGGGYGMLGIGSRDSSCAISPSCRTTTVPLVIDGNHKWKSISVGTVSVCGVTMDDRAYCWGEIRNTNDVITPVYGLLGTGSFTGSTSPVPVAGDMLWKSVTVGTRHACGLTLEGEAYCWGNNLSAEQGIGANGDRSATPRRVVGKLRFESLSADDVTCGLSVNRNVYCWGQTYAGALGNGVLGPGTRTVPTRIISP